MSGVGTLAWVVALAVLAATASGFLPAAMAVLPIPLLACAGLYDSWRYGRLERRR